MFTRSFLTACAITFVFATFGLATASSKNKPVTGDVRIGTTEIVPITKEIHLNWFNEGMIDPEIVNIEVGITNGSIYTCSSYPYDDIDDLLIRDEDLFSCDIYIPSSEAIAYIESSTEYLQKDGKPWLLNSYNPSIVVETDEYMQIRVNP